MTEVWVMRVVCDAASPMAMMAAVKSAVASGTYHVVNGDVVEPVECVEVPESGDLERSQVVASERAVAAHARTGVVHKVVLTADL